MSKCDWKVKHWNQRSLFEYLQSRTKFFCVWVWCSVYVYFTKWNSCNWNYHFCEDYELEAVCLITVDNYHPSPWGHYLHVLTCVYLNKREKRGKDTLYSFICSVCLTFNIGVVGCINLFLRINLCICLWRELCVIFVSFFQFLYFPVGQLTSGFVCLSLAPPSIPVPPVLQKANLIIWYSFILKHFFSSSLKMPAFAFCTLSTASKIFHRNVWFGSPILQKYFIFTHL